MHPKSISLGAIWGNDHMRSVKEFTVSRWEKTHHTLRWKAERAGEINIYGFSKTTILSLPQIQPYFNRRETRIYQLYPPINYRD